MVAFQERQNVKESSVEQKENCEVSTAAPVAAGTSRTARRPQRAATTTAKSPTVRANQRKKSCPISMSYLSPSHI
jgi:pantothenate kinase